MKINEAFVRFYRNFFFGTGFRAYDKLEWKLMIHKLNLRDGEIVKITIEKIKEL